MSPSEFRRAHHLARLLAPEHTSHIVVPNGDDAAALRVDGALVATTDMLVEHQDFTDAWPWDAVGHKALAQNLSDLAAMGAQPVGYLLGISAPAALDTRAWDGLVQGLLRLQRAHAVGCVGGDLSATRGPVTLSITALGQVPPHAALTRAGARPGDTLFVSGALGGAAAGVRWLLGPRAAHTDTHIQAAVDAQWWPQPRVALGLALRGVASACIDVSDGLVQDLCHVLVASNVGAVVDPAALPRHPGTHGLPPEDAEQAVLGGGEDYELLFAAPDPAAAQRAAAAAGVRVTPVGTITGARGLTLGDVHATGDEVDALHFGETPPRAEVARWRGFRHAV